MFDIGFSELLMVAVVALIVLGPQRLPETIRFVGLWIGRLRRGLSAARRELEQEIGMDDIRRQLHNEEVLRELEKSRQTLAGLGRRDSGPASSGQSSPTVAGTSGHPSSIAPEAGPPENAPAVPRQDKGQ